MTQLASESLNANNARLEFDASPSDADAAANGLAQLVLSLVKLLHDVLEQQAIRRMEADSLTDDEIELLGTTLMRQAEELGRLCDHFDIELEDLDLKLPTVQEL